MITPKLDGQTDGAQQIKTHDPNMKDPVDKLVEQTGTFTKFIEVGVAMSIKRAHKAINHLCWFQVIKTRGCIEQDKMDHRQVNNIVGFSANA